MNRLYTLLGTMVIALSLEAMEMPEPAKPVQKPNGQKTSVKKPAPGRPIMLPINYFFKLSDVNTRLVQLIDNAQSLSEGKVAVAALLLIEKPFITHDDIYELTEEANRLLHDKFPNRFELAKIFYK